MTKHVATAIGFFVAPLVAAIGLLTLGAVRSELVHWDWTVFAWMAVYYGYALGGALIIGLPMYWLLSRYDKVTWWSATVAGVLCGAVMALIFFPRVELLVVVIGGISGFSFWVIWQLGRKTRASY